LAQLLEQTGRADEAVDHYRERLRMNRNDNQGAPYLLIQLLFEQPRDEEAGSLLAEYKDDMQATWQYVPTLWTFRTQGDSDAAGSPTRLVGKRRAHFGVLKGQFLSSSGPLAAPGRRYSN